MTPPVGASHGVLLGGQGSKLPSSLVHQYDAIDDWSQGDGAIPDGPGSADMTINGTVTDGTIGLGTGAEGDGSDGHGLANISNFAQNKTFGIAITFRLPSISSFKPFFGVSDDGAANPRIAIFSGVYGSPGNLEIHLRDNNDNRVILYTDNTYDDDTIHTAVINKFGNTGSDIDFYVDNMLNPVSATVEIDSGFDHTNFTQSRDLGFWARNNGGTIQDYLNATAGVWEFNGEPYDQSDREQLISRRPEVSFIVQDEITLLTSDSNEWYTDGVRPVSLIQNDSTSELWLYFEGKQSSTKPFNSAIGIAISTDNGATWTIDDNKGKVLTAADTGEYGVRGLSVVPPDRSSDSDWHAYYVVRTNSSDFVSELRHATSSDGLSWTDDADNPLWDTDDPFHASVWEEGDTWYLYTSEGNNTPQDIFSIESTTMDASSWGNRTVRLSPGTDSWESNRVREPDIRPTSGGWEMLYVGVESTGVFDVGRATAGSLSGTWSRDPNSPFTFSDRNYPVWADERDYSLLSQSYLFAQDHTSSSTQRYDLIR